MILEFGVMGLSLRRHSQKFQALLEEFVFLCRLLCFRRLPWELALIN